MKEFEDLESFLETAEDYIGVKYDWSVYNVLILPMGFPFGGMENPNLTTLHPMLVVGDKSQVHVAMHEISHSWFGNFVTNANWEGFFLNEGFTTFLERKVFEHYNGEDKAILEYFVGQIELDHALAEFASTPNYRKLAPDYTGVDPDEGFSVVPYEKGSILLLYIESKVGRVKFRAFLNAYVQNFKLQSLDITEALNFLKDYFKNEPEVMKINFDEMLSTTDKLNLDMKLESDEYNNAVKLGTEILKGVVTQNLVEKYQAFGSKGKYIAMAEIDKNIAKATIKSYFALLQLIQVSSPLFNIDQYYYLAKIGLMLKIEASVSIAEQVVSTCGRGKILREVYPSLIAYDVKIARAIFDKYKNLYHPIGKAMVERMFEKEDKKSAKSIIFLN